MRILIIVTPYDKRPWTALWNLLKGGRIGHGAYVFSDWFSPLHKNLADLEMTYDAERNVSAVSIAGHEVIGLSLELDEQRLLLVVKEKRDDADTNLRLLSEAVTYARQFGTQLIAVAYHDMSHLRGRIHELTSSFPQAEIAACEFTTERPWYEEFIRLATQGSQDAFDAIFERVESQSLGSAILSLKHSICHALVPLDTDLQGIAIACQSDPTGAVTYSQAVIAEQENYFYVKALALLWYALLGKSFPAEHFPVMSDDDIRRPDGRAVAYLARMRKEWPEVVDRWKELTVHCGLRSKDAQDDPFDVERLEIDRGAPLVRFLLPNGAFKRMADLRANDNPSKEGFEKALALSNSMTFHSWLERLVHLLDRLEAELLSNNR